MSKSKIQPNNDLPKLVPDKHGAYLISAWQTLREQQIAKEDYTLNPMALQDQLISWMLK